MAEPSSAPAPRTSMERPAIFVCDMQEKFRNAIWEFDKVILTARKVLRAAQILSIPVFATTQNRSRLGDTVAELQPLLPPGAVTADKTRFSMWHIPAITAHFDGGRSGKHTVALVGIETHICVTQTALDLLRAGHEVHVLADGVSSSRREEVGVALARLRAAGAVVTTSEAWLYECVGDAAVPEFRDFVALIKETGGDTAVAMKALLGGGGKL